MPTELKIRKVRSVTVSGVQPWVQGEGKYARVLTVRSEDGHIYNITLVSDRSEWLDLDEGTPMRPRRHGDGGKEARGVRVPVAVRRAARADTTSRRPPDPAYAGGLNRRKKLPVVAAASTSSGMSLSRATSSAT
jgi:hypothetical protein